MTTAREAGMRLLHASSDEAEARHDFHAAIRREHAEGKTYRQLGAELGMSHQRIAQICKEDS